jgi:hypothetical protein
MRKLNIFELICLLAVCIVASYSSTISGSFVKMHLPRLWVQEEPTIHIPIALSEVVTELPVLC